MKKINIARFRYIFVVLVIIILTSCKGESVVLDDDKDTSLSKVIKTSKGATYTQISMEQAHKMMKDKKDYIILDVRTKEEYDDKHIKGAICIPNETITDKKVSKLPNKEQLILVYCRSGNRSKQASAKLADIGYTNVYEFGGIIDWTGKTE